MSTIKDVAKMAGVSPSTVSRALSGKVPVEEHTRQRIMECVEALKYQPNTLARGLKEGRTHTIAFVIPNIANQIYPTLAIAVETEARKRGYFVVFCNTNDDQQTEREYVEKLKMRAVDGFIFSTALEGIRSSTILELQEEGVPAVCLMRAYDNAKNAFVVDNVAGARQAVDFLLDRGFQRIATVTGRPGLLLYQERMQGFRQAMEARGVPCDDTLIWQELQETPDKGYFCVKQHLQQLQQLPQAIFAQSDPLAVGAIRAIHELGLRVPEDISVIGFDNMMMAQHYIPALTTVEQPLYEMGCAATRELIAMIEKKAERMQTFEPFPTRVVVRNSVTDCPSMP